MIAFMALFDNEEDRTRFEEMYYRYRKKMVVVAYSILDDRFEAEDAVHETFMAIARHMDIIGRMSETSVSAYVIKATRNRALNMLSKRIHGGESTLYISDMMEDQMVDRDFWDRMENRLTVDEMTEVLLEMDPIYRDVLYMFYLNNIPSKQIADILGRKHFTVKQQIIRGRRMLLVMIKQKEGKLDDTDKQEHHGRRRPYRKKSRT